ncbi:mitochondrial import inner membrane translocase subunit Tim23 isoform X2 [Chrysoperla carnea]|uniref:mitochondrial import inner membrane translocase subunit Tim23 isoform X2 n=1 Tax=Chrysoperla carnea TaxID=189513 RepID=UPI001D0722B1|nr:mitochondrial import inner membrane translocase subunit Tim23 isoform X2 [Chrysoperla carnea]
MEGQNDSGSDDIFNSNLGNVDLIGKRLSPYLNYDLNFIPQSQPDYIFLEGAGKQRGRFELAFGQIGASAMTGAAVGGINGLYNGLKATTLAGEKGKLRRTQLINHVMKNGSATANTLGTIAVMYSTFGVCLSWIRGTDDDLNTLVAASATGVLYKSTAGLRKCAMGGAIGLSLAAVYCLWNSRENLQNITQRM